MLYHRTLFVMHAEKSLTKQMKSVEIHLLCWFLAHFMIAS